MATSARILPYLLSWGILAVLMIVGMNRLPFALYTPIDGEWAKWNVEAILKFGKPFDLSPYSMLAGMGSMYFPNLPWLNPGALALGLPLSDHAKNIASYAVYAAELAVSIILLARSIGFSWLMATAAAQLYLYLLFPPFATVFQVYNWYALAPYYAHLAAALNAATAVFLACGRTGDWRRNILLSVAFLRLVRFRAAVGALHLCFCHPCLCRDLRCGHPGKMATARRMGLEERGAALVSDLLFWIRIALLLSRNHCDIRPHTHLGNRVGQDPVAWRLAAAVRESPAVPGSALTAVHPG
jgi:hypothetical protein